MKNNFLIIMAILFILIASFSCSKDNSSNELDKITVNDFSKIGEIHNSFLTNIHEKFNCPDYITDKNEKVNFINNFNQEYISSIDFSETLKQKLYESFEQNKLLVLTDHLVSISFYSKNKSSSSFDEDSNVFELLTYIKNAGVISANAYDILNRLSTYTKSNYENEMSDEQLKISVQNLINEFDDYGYISTADEGEFVGTVLAISMASIEWWEENPDALGDLKVAPWVGADIIGGIWGGATGAAGSYAGTGSVNWTSVGVGAISGAIAGSTGAVGKIAKWLF